MRRAEGQRAERVEQEKPRRTDRSRHSAKTERRRPQKATAPICRGIFRKLPENYSCTGRFSGINGDWYLTVAPIIPPPVEVR